MDTKEPSEIPIPLTVYEFMRAARCCESTARRWIKSGKVPTIRIGRRLLIPREVLAKLISLSPRVTQ